MSALPPWPEIPETVPSIESFNHITPFGAMAWHDYENARAEAAMSRLSGAVKIASDYRDGMISVRQCAQQLEAWLSAIGSVPNT